MRIAEHKPFDESQFADETSRLLTSPPQWMVKVRNQRSPLSLIRRQKLAAEIWGRRLAIADLMRQMDDIAQDPEAVIEDGEYTRFTREGYRAVGELEFRVTRLNEQCELLALCLRNLGGPVGNYVAVAPRISRTESVDLPSRFWRGEGSSLNYSVVVPIISIMLIVLSIAAIVILAEVFG